MTRGPNSTWNLDSGHNSTWNHDPGSQFNVELWPGVTIQRGIITPGQNFTLYYDPGHSSTLNCDPNPGSQLNVEPWLGVKIQRWIRTWGHNSTWNKDPGSQFNRGQNFIRRRVVIQWPPVSGGRNSTWKIRWILSTARWIKTPRVEIQWGQNSILHRHWPAASIARVSCSSLFSPSDVLPFCVRNWGTTIWFWGGGGWHFVEINILTLKMLKINNLSSSVKKTNNLTLTFLQLGGGGCQFFPYTSASFARNSYILKYFSGSLCSQFLNNGILILRWIPSHTVYK